MIARETAATRAKGIEAAQWTLSRSLDRGKGLSGPDAARLALKWDILESLRQQLDAASDP